MLHYIVAAIKLRLQSLVLAFHGYGSFTSILGKMIGSIDKTGKLLTIINKISSIIIIIVALMILQKLIQLLF